MLHPHVAPGVHWIEDSYVNWYLIEDGTELTVVDCGLPGSWHSLTSAVERLGHRMSDVRAIVLTHAHFDHVGFAERARRDLNIPVYCHEREAALTRHPLRYKHERSRLDYIWRPANLRAMSSFIVWGMLKTPAIKAVETYREGQVLGVPGKPQVVFTPGHTFGHCSLHLPDRGVLLAGDAVVTWDPYTGQDGPKPVARGATADSKQAYASLDALARTRAQIVLTGHGDPWTKGAAAAAEAAMRSQIG